MTTLRGLEKFSMLAMLTFAGKRWPIGHAELGIRMKTFQMEGFLSSVLC
ncbi:hypothetical protein IFT92_22725 [Peribacillus simplex]|nr:MULTISPECIES: hypothetical protein [Bacillaceae]MBD8590557.1 hypothetical protein [Peribacillus simplex]MCF7622444.1 hypothetical protein [Peribacillus frigoritolerans]MEA3576865.1 hypothetical protein [Peribacillus frigoritolerans]